MWSAQAEWDEWARHSEGSCVLRTNVTQLAAMSDRRRMTRGA